MYIVYIYIYIQCIYTHMNHMSGSDSCMHAAVLLGIYNHLFVLYPFVPFAFCMPMACSPFVQVRSFSSFA